MQALAAVGIQHSGRRGDFASFETSGLKIAFMAFAVTRNSNLVQLMDAQSKRRTALIPLQQVRSGAKAITEAVERLRNE